MPAIFDGGPAAGKQLAISRYPVYLRVVVAPDGSIDALDQLDDEVREGEAVHVYLRTSHFHVCGENRVRDSYWSAFYATLPHVDGEALRDNDAWREWAQAQPETRAPQSVGEGR